jgi:hypothetical protein
MTTNTLDHPIPRTLLIDLSPTKRGTSVSAAFESRTLARGVPNLAFYCKAQVLTNARRAGLIALSRHDAAQARLLKRSAIPAPTRSAVDTTTGA